MQYKPSDTTGMWDKGKLIELLDLKRIVLETDSPYLADGPWDIIAVAEEVANIKGCPLQEVLRYTRDNAARVYGP